ncbi:hypothetical protein AB996_1959 [Lactococcus cremoris]|uniref:Uncharacterized protein n=1 Tax=Lactococcus lactis subsp. cremoris TaxID=1359 RepID=A0A166J0W5_LACLC|nr:hypothetical protein AB996_1959 [Lactococcus cremoris]
MSSFLSLKFTDHLKIYSVSKKFSSALTYGFFYYNVTHQPNKLSVKIF